MSSYTKEALSHLLLAGTTIGCFLYIDKSSFKWVHVSYGVLCIYSCIGLWTYGYSGAGEESEKVYEVAEVVQRSVTMPCILCELYTSYSYEWYFSPVQSALPFIPITLYAIYGDVRREVRDVMASVDFLIILSIALVEQNHWGIISGVTYLTNYFIDRLEDLEHRQNIIGNNMGLSFIIFFSSMAVADAHKTV